MLLVLVSTPPHLLEGRERGEDAPTLPRCQLPLRRCRDSNLQILRRKLSYFIQKPISEPREHRGAAREHDVTKELLPQVEVRFKNRIDEDLKEREGGSGEGCECGCVWGVVDGCTLIIISCC